MGITFEKFAKYKYRESNWLYKAHQEVYVHTSGGCVVY